MTGFALLRPQPLGLLDPPAGLLVVPAVDGAADAVAAMVAGRRPEPWPDGLAFLAAAAAGDVEGALAALTGDDPVSRYDRFVLAPSAGAWASLGSLPEPLATLAAVVAWSEGLTPERPGTAGLDGELRAVAALAEAGDALDRGDVGAALAALQEGAGAARPVSPLLAAQLVASAAEVRLQQEGPGPAVLAGLAEAARAAGQAWPELAAAWWTTRGIAAHELGAGGQPGAYTEAVHSYEEALRTYRSDTHPEAYARAQVNLALAYLAMPMQAASDQLRAGVAVQALRSARAVLDPDRHPDLWSSATLNLANALQYLPSALQRRHLAEAVGLYDEVLARRAGDGGAGRARLLANKGNALAHLGDLDGATACLEEAAARFGEQGDDDAGASVRATLDEIGRLRA